MKEKFNVNGISFFKKKDLKEYIDAIVLKYHDSVVGSPDHEFLFCFYRLHPEFEEKYKSRNVVNFQVIRNPVFGHYAIHALLDDGHFEDIAVRNCIRQRCMTDDEDHKLAYRFAIADQIISFKRNSLMKCEICSTIQSDFHVDHLILFKTLVENFEKIHGKPKAILQDKNSRTRFFEDRIFQKLWEDYHKQNAVLRILCSNCNLTRKKN